MDDFNRATQRAIAALAKESDNDDNAADLDKEDIFEASLDRLYVRVRKDCRKLDDRGRELDSRRKEVQEEMKHKADALKAGKNSAGKMPDAAELNEEALEPYKHASQKLEKSLEAFTLRVRSQLVGRKDLGDKFSRAADALFVDLKKFDNEVEKSVATELKRKPREEKKMEVMPSKFLSDFKTLLKKSQADGKDPKREKALKEAEESLKRLDTNGSFDKVTTLSDTAQSSLKELMKNLGKDDSKLSGSLKDLAAAIDKYDNHMFLLGRQR